MSTVWDVIHEMAQQIAEMRGDLVAHEQRTERMFRKGKVTDVDAENRKYRQEIGVDDDGNPVKSPWVRYSQVAGDRATHAPPFVGQQMLLFSPDGDHEQGVGIPHTFSNDIPSPSKKDDEHVDQWGKSKDTVKKDQRLIECGSSGIDVKDGKLVITANDIVLVGNISLGADGASRELALKDSIDTAGDKMVDNLSTKVKAV